MTEPKYWGTIKGQILNIIVNEFVTQEEGLHYYTHLPLEIIKQTIKELMQTGELSYNSYGELWVQYSLYKEYEEYGFQKISDEVLKYHPLVSDTKKLDIIEWIYQWKEKNDPSISLDNKHFFVEGDLLTEITNGLLKNIAQENVIIVNPFVDVCSTTRILSVLKMNGVNVDIITRNPETDDHQYSKDRKKECHKDLLKNGVNLFYNNYVHAKMVLIDNRIAINSSMNLTGTSVGSQSWETGVITYDENNIQSISKSLLSLLRSNLTIRQM